MVLAQNHLYLYYMRLKTYLLFCLVTFSLIGIRLSIAIDDPDHLLIPNPDCPICQAYNSPVFIDFDINVTSLSIILAYLNEQSPEDLYFNSLILKGLIRAPPFC